MEPISAIALSLALGAGAVAGKEAISAIVKDAYAVLKQLIKGRYPEVSLDQLEQAPQSKNRRAVVEEDLMKAGAGHDPELAEAADKLLKLVREQQPNLATVIGIDLEEIEAANLRLTDIVSSGTGVRLTKSKIRKDIEIRGVHAGTTTASEFEKKN